MDRTEAEQKVGVLGASFLSEHLTQAGRDEVERKPGCEREEREKHASTSAPADGRQTSFRIPAKGRAWIQ